MSKYISIKISNKDCKGIYLLTDSDIKFIATAEEANKIINSTFKLQLRIKVGADILNSFTSCFSAYGMDAHIDIKIPKKDIFCYSDVLESVMESNEFIVINRSRDGLIEIPVDKIFKTYDRRSDDIENRWRIVNYKKSPYHFVNFAMNTQVDFYKPEKLRSPTKPNIVCKLLKKTNKCCEIY